MSLLRRIFKWIKKKIFSKTFIKFNIVGASGILVNMIVFWLLTSFTMVHYLLSGAIATEISILSNFILNHLWTFSDRRRELHILVRLAAFHASRLLGLFVTVGVLYLLTDMLSLYLHLAYLIATGFGVLANFYTSDVFVWAEK